MVRVPVFALDGRLLTEPGYDPASGLFVALPADLRVPPVPTRPSASELDEAVGWVTDELLGDFPFTSEADRAHVLALLLAWSLPRTQSTPPYPLFVFSKPLPRTRGDPARPVPLACPRTGAGRRPDPRAPIPMRCASA